MGELVNATIRLTEGMCFEASADSGHALAMDVGEEAGGRNRGFRPMELLLLGLGGCTAFDIVAILRKMKQSLSGYEIRLSGERASNHPRVYEKIRIEHLLYGHDLKKHAIDRAIHLSMGTYCSAVAMLQKTATIEVEYRVIETDAQGDMAAPS